MNRTLIGLIWVYAGWTAGTAGASLLGASALLGPIAGIAALAIFAFTVRAGDRSPRRNVTA